MKKILFAFVMLCIAVAVSAVPARRNVKKIIQSDGTVLYVRLLGDETLHYHATIDGIPLVPETNGDFSYAKFVDGAFVSTNVLAHEAAERSAVELQIINENESNGMTEAIRKVAATRSAAYNQPRRSQTIRPVGEKNILVLLVEFSDVKFTFERDSIALNFNGVNYYGAKNPETTERSGSVRDYFVAQSDGQFIPNFVTTRIITLSQPMAYYGGNDARGDDKRPQDMIVEACRAIDAEVDFSVYDNDGDGTVEFLYCLYAGYSESGGSGADENTIWPHNWYLSSSIGTINLDGVKIDNYCCSSELGYTPAEGVWLNGIGNCCHEFSHSLGLPDFYDTSTSDYRNFGMDYWDLMDYGCYNAEGYLPIGYSAYERDFMGWRKLEVLTEPGDYSMEALTAGGKAYKIVNDANSNEYYILENRQQETWDKYIFNTGMLVTHVDYSSSAWYDNNVNVDASHQRFTLIPADNKLLTWYDAASSSDYAASLRGDTWPGTSGKTALTDETSPAAKVYTGGYMGKPVTNIAENNNVVSFSFMAKILSAPVALPATDITDNSFVANWEAVDGADEYQVVLERMEQNQGGGAIQETLLQEDFMNCAASGSGITDIDAFVSDTGWSGTNIYSETGTIRVGSSSNYGTLSTPEFSMPAGDVTLTFKAKLYNAKDTGVALSVNCNNETIESYSITSSSWKSYTVTFSVDKDFDIMFSTVNSTGNKRVLIDDLIITAETSFTAVPVNFATTTSLNFKFDNLENNAKYRYFVKAISGNSVSVASQYINVDLLATGIDDVTVADGIVEIYSIGGVSVYKGNASEVPNLPKGIYITYNNGVARKYIVR